MDSSRRSRWFLLVLVWLNLAPWGLGGVAKREVDANEPPPIREIFVPFEDLPVLLEGADQRVLLTREEYGKLVEQARVVPVEEASPQARVLLSAEYETTIEEGRATTRAKLEIEVLAKELLAIPLPLRGVTLRSATWDGGPALLGQDAEGLPTLFARGVGRHQLELELLSGLETAAAQQTLSIQIPVAASTRWRISAPGNVEIKSGAQVMRREVDADGLHTRFELLPQRDPMRVVLSLNNRVLLQQRMVLARSVLMDELTQTYDRLHATVSLAIPHGAVDRFRFELPAGYEVTDVATPLLARWSEGVSAGGGRTLDVQLREATRETVVLQIVAIRHASAGDAPAGGAPAGDGAKGGTWTMPQLKPLDVASHVAVLGLLVDERLVPRSLTPTGLIPIDTAVLREAMPASLLRADPNEPRVRPIAAFFAPQADFQLTAQYQTTPATVETTSNLLFTLDDRKLQVRAGFAVRPLVDRVFQLEVAVPNGWQVQEVSQEDGGKLAWELFAGEAGGTRLQIRIPQGAAPNADFSLFLHASTTPAGWLNEWSQTSVVLPSFAVAGVARDSGAVAVQLLDDLLATPEQLTGLTPLDQREKGAFGWSEIATNLAYRYESQPYSLMLKVERPQPRVTARVLNFLRVETADLVAHYEVLFQVEQARARRLTLRLPASTPEALSIRGLNVQVKEFRSQKSNGDRDWIVELAEPTAGPVQLLVDFQQPLPVEVRGAASADSSVARNIPLPVLQATGVDYQSGAIAVEGNMEFDIEVKTDARKVDIGELADAQYAVGKRLLGAFGYVQDSGVVLASISRRSEFGLPSAITQRAELVTVASSRGISQTAARFQLRTKAPFLEIALPRDSTLWAVMVGGKPVSPQRNEERILVSLAGVGDELRDLQLVYETAGSTWDRWGRFAASAPRLMLRNEAGTERLEVPLADLEWHLVLPEGQELIRSQGNVVTRRLGPDRSPAWVAARSAAGVLGAFAYTAASVGSAVAPRSESTVDRQRYRTDSRRYYLNDDFQSSSEGALAPSDGEAPSPNAISGPMAEPQMALPAVEMQVPKSEPAPAPTAAAPAVPSSPPGSPGRAGTDQPVPPPTPAEPPVEAPTVVADPAQRPANTTNAEKGRAAANQYWALQGVRSLPVEVVREGETWTFHSLGLSPELRVTLASARSIDFLAATLALLVALLGLLKTPQSVGRKIRFLGWSGLALLLIPHLVGLVSGLELTRWFAPSFYVVCLLVPWYLLAGCASLLVAAGRRLFAANPARVGATAALLCVLGAVNVSGQEPTIDGLRDWLQGRPPVKVPENAVVIPYDPTDPIGAQRANKVFVPYAEYVKLWNRAFPTQPLTPTATPAPFALGGASYRATLSDDESLLVSGRFTVEVFAAGAQAIPLPLQNAVLTKMTVDGQPARLEMLQPVIPMPRPESAPNAAQQQQRVIQPPPPPAAIPAVRIDGQGRHEVVLELRFKVTRTGGWRVVDGQVPTSAATALDLVVPLAKTQVRLGGTQNPLGVIEQTTERADQAIPSALGTHGRLQLQWRPQITEAMVDQSLTARSFAVLDVREDTVRATWQVEFEFRRGVRDSFTLSVPANLLLEKVLGPNVRGWKSTPNGEQATIDVTLLKPATGNEKFTLLLSRREVPGKDPSGDDPSRAFSAPVASVVGAALHQGTLVVRRSPQLELRVDAATGLVRADADQAAIDAVLANVDDDSPLGVRPFQTYRFAATPFDLRLHAARTAATTSVVSQALLKVMERESRWETRINVTVENRPRFQLRCRLPAGLRLDEVAGVAPLEWTTTPAAAGDLLNVWIPQGQQSFSLILRGRLPQQQMESFPAPTLDVLDVDRHLGQLVVQADPGLEVRADDFRGCEQVLLEQVFGWLQDDQRSLARFALAHRGGEYGATLRVSPRPARVRGMTISNARVTSNTIEDTLYLQFTIQDAGVRSVRFQLPAALREARITAPLLRQKTVEPIAENPDRVRVTLDLQDAVTDQFIVLVSHDRPLVGGRYEVPIPVLETGETDQRYLVWENAGRDEVSVAAAEQLTELNRQQAQWARLAEILGDKILRAYLVREDAATPRLQLETKQRSTVQTAGARIGLAETVLMVDSHGAYRGVQQYHVDNKTEQYLEIELPDSAELWTTRVAGEPVKPVLPTSPNAGRTTGPRICFVPLIKTAAGDLDYVVELKYAGRMTIPRGVEAASFPFLHTKNIRVELSQVRLRLPDDRRWYDLRGSMRYVRDEGELLAGFFSYQSKQVSQLLDLMRDGESFTKIRATNNFRQLGIQLQQATSSYSDYRQNSDFQREIDKNSGLVRQAEQLLGEQEATRALETATDNRAALFGRSQAQAPARSNNQVFQLQSNFDADDDVEKLQRKSPAEEGFNRKWLRNSQLDSTPAQKPDAKSKSNEVLRDLEEKTWASKPMSQSGTDKSDVANKLGKKLAEVEREARSKEGRPAGEADALRFTVPADANEAAGQAARYQQKLELQNRGILEQKQVDDSLGRQATDQADLYVLPGPSGALGGRQGGMGGFGGGVGGTGSGNLDFAGSMEPNRGEVPSMVGLASLDVELPRRGVEYRFTTPGGEIAVSARSVDAGVAEHGRAVAILAVLGVVGWFVSRRRVSPRLA